MSGPPLPPRDRSVVVDEGLVMQSIKAEVKEQHSDGKGEEGETKTYDIPALSELRMLRLSFKSEFVCPDCIRCARLSLPVQTFTRLTTSRT